MTTEYTHMLVSLFGIISLIAVLFFMVKKLKLASYAGNKQIKILNAVSIGPKEKMLLVEVNKTVLLIGATTSHIETLYVFNNELDAEQAVLPQTQKTFAEQVTCLTEG